MRVTLTLLLLALMCTGCEKAAQNMYDQPKYLTYRASPLFGDGKSQQDDVPDTQVYSRGFLAGTSSGREGVDVVTRWRRDDEASTNPYAISMDLLQHGRERYDIYCAPCHSPVGDGNGLIVQHGFPAPPTLHSDRIRASSDQHLVDVISHGYGMMYGYADRISPQDRWAIVAYVRALQLSQHTPVEALTAQERTSLKVHAP